MINIKDTVFILFPIELTISYLFSLVNVCILLDIFPVIFTEEFSILEEILKVAKEGADNDGLA